MNTKRQIDTLWFSFRTAINKAYEHADYLSKHGNSQEPRTALRDYAENISWSDNLSGLLGRETANERQHRTNRPSVPGFSPQSAAKLILMSQVSEGANLDAVPDGTTFLVFRQTAAEARVLGYLCKSFLTPEWHAAIHSLDYSKLMQS